MVNKVKNQLFGIKLFNLGLIGAALSTSISFLIMFILSLFNITKEYNISYRNWWKIIILNTVLIYILIQLINLINLNIYLEIIIVSIIARSIYLLLGYSWKIVNYKEIIRLLKKNEKIQAPSK